MAQIYRNAERDLIWLSYDSDDIEKDYDVESSGSSDEDINSNDIDYQETGTLASARSADPGTTDVKNQGEVRWYEKHQDRPYYDLSYLTRHRWFSRVWVVQELCMAAGDPLIVSNDVEVPWSVLCRLCEEGDESRIRNMNNMRARAQKPPRVRNVDNASRRDASLLEDDLFWFRCTAMLEASDARDKFFALLGLTRGPLGRSTKIDYSVEASSLVQKVMTNQIEEHHNLDLLTLCNWTTRLDKKQQCPWWMPDLLNPGLHALPVVELDLGKVQRSNSRPDPFFCAIAGCGGTVGARACATLHDGGKREAIGFSLGGVAAIVKDNSPKMTGKEWREKRRQGLEIDPAKDDWKRLLQFDDGVGLHASQDTRHSLSRMINLLKSGIMKDKSLLDDESLLDPDIRREIYLLNRKSKTEKLDLKLTHCEEFLSKPTIGLPVWPIYSHELRANNVELQLDRVSQQIRSLSEALPINLTKDDSKAQKWFRVYESLPRRATAATILDTHWRPLTSRISLDYMLSNDEDKASDKIF